MLFLSKFRLPCGKRSCPGSVLWGNMTSHARGAKPKVFESWHGLCLHFRHRHIGVTNFTTPQLRLFIDAGVPVVAGPEPAGGTSGIAMLNGEAGGRAGQKGAPRPGLTGAAGC